MNSSSDISIDFNICIVDADLYGRKQLVEALSNMRDQGERAIEWQIAQTIPDAYETLTRHAPNVVFIDILSTGLRDSVTFIQHVRVEYPTIVFVLYSRESDLERQADEIYSGWGTRLRHYFLLSKEVAEINFLPLLRFNLNRVEIDLHAYGVGKSLSRAESIAREVLTPVQISKLQSQIEQLGRQIAAIGIRQSAEHGNKVAKRRAFVIIAFDSKMDDIYTLGICKHLGDCFGLQTFRADTDYRHSLLIQKIYIDIHSSTLVIAELSHPNVNCYFELGYAEALGKPIIRVAREGTSLPFDNSQYQVLFYKNITDLQKRLSDAIVDMGLVCEEL